MSRGYLKNLRLQRGELFERGDGRAVAARPLHFPRTLTYCITQRRVLPYIATSAAALDVTRSQTWGFSSAKGSSRPLEGAGRSYLCTSAREKQHC